MTPQASSQSTFNRILVAVDGSENSLLASKVAIGLAKKHKSNLTVLNVLFLAPYWMSYSQAGMPPVYMAELEKHAKKDAEDLVQKIVTLADGEGVAAKGEVLENIPSAVQAITDFAANERVDLIVVGTRGLSGFKKLIIGSVLSGVVAHAPCSVLVVR